MSREHDERQDELGRFGPDPQLCPACVEGRTFCPFHRQLAAKGICPERSDFTMANLRALLKEWDRQAEAERAS